MSMYFKNNDYHMIIESTTTNDGLFIKDNSVISSVKKMYFNDESTLREIYKGYTYTYTYNILQYTGDASSVSESYDISRSSSPIYTTGYTEYTISITCTELDSTSYPSCSVYYDSGNVQELIGYYTGSDGSIHSGASSGITNSGSGSTSSITSVRAGYQDGRDEYFIETYTDSYVPYGRVVNSVTSETQYSTGSWNRTYVYDSYTGSYGYRWQKYELVSINKVEL